jgi:uncharacterized pyridoxal phosphate-containing UPF0001 family protein
MDVLVEVNSGEEARKTGVSPDNVEQLIQQIRTCSNIRVVGLMTMGPWRDDAEALRPYFRQTRALFEGIKKLSLPNCQMIHLSMGMSHSYRVAIEEGATIIRLGTILFGPRS